MFSLFKKKENLGDQFEGFVDIHNHVLPGIDDGANSIEDTLELIQKYEKLGIREIIATPHIMNDYYPNTRVSINTALQKLQERVTPDFPGFQIRAAAEYMMDHSFLEIMEREKLLCLKKDFVLVEMSYFQAPINLNEILFQLQTQQYKPILAHPERYTYLHSKDLKKYRELRERGCFFQLNILSLVGHYGKHIQQMANDLLDKQLYDFAGTDTHQVRHLDKIMKSRLTTKRMSQLTKILDSTRTTFGSTF